MGMFTKIIAIPQIFAGILSGVLAIIVLRVLYPVIDSIFALWTTTTRMKVSAIFAFLFVLWFVFYVLGWMAFFHDPMQAIKGEQNG